MRKWAMLLVLVVGGAAQADLFQVELPELLGAYDLAVGGGPFYRTASFNFGTAFSQVTGAWLSVEGTYQPGYWYGATEPPYFYDTGLLICNLYGPQEEGLARVELPGDLYFNQQCGFTLNADEAINAGTGTVEVFIGKPFHNVIFSENLVSPQAELARAVLIVEGTAAPEPTSLTLISLMALPMLRRRSR